MKKFLLLLALVGAGYKGYSYYQQHLSTQPLYEVPYVAVFGRDSCSFTQQMKRQLAATGISYRYFIVDNRDVNIFLAQRMEGQGLNTRRYNLPVVDVNGTLMIRPEPETVIQQYRSQPVSR